MNSILPLQNHTSSGTSKITSTIQYQFALVEMVVVLTLPYILQAPALFSSTLNRRLSPHICAHFRTRRVASGGHGVRASGSPGLFVEPG